MKVISIMQPWAALIVIGAKTIETRSWNTKYRGEILIHASAGKNKVNREISMDFQQEFPELQLPKYENLPFGAILGKSYIAGVSSTEIIKRCAEVVLFESEKERREWDMEKKIGDYSDGRYGWFLSDSVKFDKPIPAKGKLGIWNYNNEEMLPQ